MTGTCQEMNCTISTTATLEAEMKISNAVRVLVEHGLTSHAGTFWQPTAGRAEFPRAPFNSVHTS